VNGLPVLVRRLHPDVALPTYAHPGDAGADLVTTEAAELAPGERAVLPTGIAIALPDGYAAFVHPRSGLAARWGVALVNAPGTIDAGYRGEIKVIVVNLDPRDTVRFAAGDRICQLVIQRVERAEFHEVAELPGAGRGAAGHGSTGGFTARAMPDHASGGS
jgi:dUTP pyrophosphatase